MNKWNKFLLVTCVTILSLPAQAQYTDTGLGGGLGFGGTFGQTQLKDREGRFIARAFIRYQLIRHLQGEVGASLGRVAGADYSTQVIPIDYRFLISPFSLESWNPYVYGGFGALHYDVEQIPPQATANAKLKGWTGVVPAGVGLQIRLDDHISFEASGGFNL